MKLSEDEKQTLLKKSPGPGRRNFICCPICGYLQWAFTQKLETEDVVIEEMDSNYDCPRCREVGGRNPELYQWVMAVFDYQKRKDKERAQNSN